MSGASSRPSDAVLLDDPGNLAGTLGTALVSEVKLALDAWLPHLSGLGTLTVDLKVVDDGQTGLLADGAPTLDAVIGSEDGRTLLESGAVYELATGNHLNGGTSDITIEVNSAYLSQLFLGGTGSVPANEYDGLSLFEHEIAHGLGFGGETSQTGSLEATYETAWDHDLASVNGTEVFTGANATAANGGVEVNITTLSNGEGYAHLANSASDPNANDLMSGLGLPTGTRRPISSVDLGILADVGVPITGTAGTITVGGPATATVVAGAASSIGGLTLADTGAFTSSTLTLTLSDTAGRLSATQAAGATVAVSSTGRTLALSGSLAGVRTELASLAYVTPTTGSDTVQLAAVDSFGNTGAASLVIATAGAASASAGGPAAVLSLSATPAAPGPLGAGRSIVFALATSAPVTVGTTGLVALTLNDGGTAAYDAAASTPTSLAFTTTVSAGQDATNLTATGLILSGGASIADASGGSASLVVTAATPGAATGLVVDTQAPAAPTLALAPGSATGTSHAVILTRLASPTLDGTAEAGSLVVVTDTDTASVLGIATAGSDGTWSLAAPPLADGPHVLSATATDAAGNASSPSSLLSVTVDTRPPGIPTLSLALSSDTGLIGDGITSATTQTLTGLAEAGTTLALTDGTALLGTTTASSTGAWHYTASLSPGTHDLGATATDAAGNVSATATLAVLIETTAPAAPTMLLSASTSGSVTTLAQPTLAGTAEAGSTVLVTDTTDAGTARLGEAIASGGTWSLVASSLAEGINLLVATASDAAGNVSSATTLSVTLDSVAPSAPGTPMLASSSDGGLPTVSGTAAPGSTVTLSEGATVAGTAIAASNGAWSVTLASPLALGTTALTATATDAAGNVSASSRALDLLYNGSSSGTVGITPGAAGVPTLVTLDGTASQSESYAAGSGTTLVIAGGGSASVTAGANAASALTAFCDAGTLGLANGAGSAMVVDNGASLLVLDGGLSGSSLVVFAGHAATRYVGGAGADEIIGGDGPLSLAGGTGGSLLVFGGTGPLTLDGGGETDTVVGGAGSETIHAGVGAVFAGSGGSVLFALGAGTFLAGNLSGDQLCASATGGDILAAGSGNETLAGAGATYGDLIFGGSGADSVSLGLGADTFAAGTGGGTVQLGGGNATLYLGSGAGTVIEVAGVGGTDTVAGFRVGTDHLRLAGGAKVASLTASGGSSTLSLADGTRVVLSGVGTTNMAALTG